jgi:hypothetical protein
VTERIYTDEFLDVDAGDVHRSIVEDGYWICDRAIDPRFATALDEELGSRPLALNVNDVGPVRYHYQTYFTHALAGSKNFFDLVTHPKLRRLCGTHLGGPFRLKCQRYYQSSRHHALTWHTDDKTPLGQRTNVPGVGVVMYLRDTFEGELQPAARTSGPSRWAARPTSKTVRSLQRTADIVTISRNAGALIIFDSKILHRTRQSRGGTSAQERVLQIDADIAHSEKIIVDTQYLDPSTRSCCSISAAACLDIHRCRRAVWRRSRCRPSHALPKVARATRFRATTVRLGGSSMARFAESAPDARRSADLLDQPRGARTMKRRAISVWPSRLRRRLRDIVLLHPGDPIGELNKSWTCCAPSTSSSRVVSEMRRFSTLARTHPRCSAACTFWAFAISPASISIPRCVPCRSAIRSAGRWAT